MLFQAKARGNIRTIEFERPTWLESLPRLHRNLLADGTRMVLNMPSLVDQHPQVSSLGVGGEEIYMITFVQQNGRCTKYKVVHGCMH